MVNVEFKENPNLELNLGLLGRLFNKKNPDLAKILQELKKVNEITLEYRLEYPFTTELDSSTYAIVSIKVGNYNYNSYKRFGKHYEHPITSMKKAQKYIRNLEKYLKSFGIC